MKSPTIDDLWFKRGPDGKKNVPTPRHGKGSRWRVRYPDGGGSEVFATKPEAQRARADYITGKRPAKGGSDEWSKATGTVRQYIERWRLAQGHRPTTSERLERYLRLHVYPILGERVMNNVTSLDIQEWQGKLRAGRPDEDPPREALGSSTVTTIRAHLKGIFTAAHDDGHIDRNLFKTSNMKKKRQKPTRIERVVPPTAAEIQAAADSLSARYRTLVLVAAGSGLRQGELWGLEPKHVDLENGKITVEQQVQMVGTRRYLAPVKSESGKRTVEIASYARDALAQHMKQFPPVDVLVDDDRDEDRPGARVAKLIFTTVDGQPLNRAQWAHVWTPARERAGVRFRFHDLRHYYATVLIHNGADVKEVQVALGHANAQLVFEIYTGHWPDRDISKRDALDGDWWS